MNDTVRTVYISGPITGDPEYRDKFAAAEHTLRVLGLAAYNPADILSPLDEKGVDYDTILDCCIKIVRCHDAIALLPGWEQSNGAKLELARYCESRNAEDYVIFELNMYPDPTSPKKYSTVVTRFDGFLAWLTEHV